ncbi:ribosomal RNA-processing protein 1 [[Emmonsia] crescens]|uniref:Ribosomal RNA-processing protein 1 n=1 Tax=[Emmonsia] crescens TaxID=73230 RepID=A0A2B7ZE24_9EURO|nr:ribosomal RNA-processing protein 1 [Emmonsia crescens]
MDNIAQTPFVRELASSDKRTRDKALESLTRFIQSRRDLQLVELLKIWKGLFFCFYHSDRPLTQQSLARALSYTLVPSLPEQTLQSFLRAFWITMSRDFHSLDRLRLDKYLYLIRCYVGVAFEVFLKKGLSGAGAGTQKQKEKQEQEKEKEKGSLGKRKRGEEADENGAETESGELGVWKELGMYLDMLEEGPLCPLNFDPTSNDTNEDPAVRMHKGPDGVRYHLLDIWLDEIEKIAVVEVEGEDEGEGETGDKAMEDDDDNAEARNSTLNNDDNTKEKNKKTKKQLKDGVPMELLLRPIVRLQGKSISKMVRKRAGEVLDDERLVEWGVRERKRDDDDDDDEEEEEEDEGEGWGGIDA